MGVLQEFLLPLPHHAGIQVEISTNSIELPVPLDNGQDNLGFKFSGVLFLWYDGDLLLGLIMPKIHA